MLKVCLHSGKNSSGKGAVFLDFPNQCEKRDSTPFSLSTDAMRPPSIVHVIRYRLSWYAAADLGVCRGLPSGYRRRMLESAVAPPSNHGNLSHAP